MWLLSTLLQFGITCLKKDLTSEGHLLFGKLLYCWLQSFQSNSRHYADNKQIIVSKIMIYVP